MLAFPITNTGNFSPFIFATAILVNLILLCFQPSFTLVFEMKGFHGESLGKQTKLVWVIVTISPISLKFFDGLFRSRNLSSLQWHHPLFLKKKKGKAEWKFLAFYTLFSIQMIEYFILKRKCKMFQWASPGKKTNHRIGNLLGGTATLIPILWERVLI